MICRVQRVLGENLKKLKKKYGLSVRVIAEETGLSMQTIYDHCNGRTFPNAEAVDIYADYFGVTFSDLFKGGENEKD